MTELNRFTCETILTPEMPLPSNLINKALYTSEVAYHLRGETNGCLAQAANRLEVGMFRIGVAENTDSRYRRQSH
jgi:hypothetical protein